MSISPIEACSQVVDRFIVQDTAELVEVSLKGSSLIDHDESIEPQA